LGCNRAESCNDIRAIWENSDVHSFENPVLSLPDTAIFSGFAAQRSPIEAPHSPLRAKYSRPQLQNFIYLDIKHWTLGRVELIL
jgi:hypothetical protein